mgnify:CR=1 FL=1
MKKEVPLFKVFMAPNAGEEVSKVLHSGFIGQGTKVDEFESQLSKYFNHDYILTLNSATSAEHLAFHMLKNPSNTQIIFDGVGSTINRKNLLPEYKSGRNQHRITNWEVFEDLEDEDDAKINQIVRIAHYLKCLPVKTVAIDKAEADDIIAYYSKHLPEKYGSKCFIVSSDKDFIQLVNDDVIVYRPIEKEYYTKDTVKEKFGVLADNFILYKMLLGDNSDKVAGVKGLGAKGLFKKFPELAERVLTLDEIFEIASLQQWQSGRYRWLLRRSTCFPSGLPRERL